MKEPKLLPCPFCGSNNLDLWGCDHYIELYCCVVCQNCGSRGPTYCTCPDSVENPEAYEKWNKRKEIGN